MTNLRVYILYFISDNKTDVGQNLAVISGAELTIERALELFYDERNNYDFFKMSYVHNKTFYDVGHYFQVKT